MTIPLPAQLEPRFTHQTAQVNGVRLHYVIGGQGFPVVLLHGWPQTWYEWRKIMPALAEKYTVIAPDSRGMGDSERTESGYDAATLAEDAFSLVRSLGFGQMFLVGHDTGVSTAYACAAQYREAVQRLVILDVPLEGFGREEFALKRNIWWFGFFQATRSLAESLAEGRERILLQWFFSPARNSAAFTQEDIDEYVRCYSGRDALRAGFEYYRSFSTNAQLFTVAFVRDGDVRVIIDPGMVPDPKSILEPLAALGESPATITDVIFSHHHPDHTLHAALFAHARFHDHWAIYQGDGWQKRRAEGYAVTASIRLIETPGHTPQDITTLVGTRDGVVAFTHLWWSASGPAEDPSASDAAALHQNRARVLRVAQLIVPGHGAPFLPDESTPR